jgi:hypothetical protein
MRRIKNPRKSMGRDVSAKREHRDGCEPVGAKMGTQIIFIFSPKYTSPLRRSRALFLPGG